ncbi:MAG: hypothetical protein GY861_15525, partial [bacterium]|nr:hypothetical protein [bacterium]
EQKLPYYLRQKLKEYTRMKGYATLTLDILRKYLAEFIEDARSLEADRKPTFRDRPKRGFMTGAALQMSNYQQYLPQSSSGNYNNGTYQGNQDYDYSQNDPRGSQGLPTPNQEYYRQFVNSTATFLANLSTAYNQNSVPQVFLNNQSFLSHKSDNVIMMMSRASISNKDKNRFWIVRVFFDSGSKVSFLRSKIGHYLNPEERSMPQHLLYSRFNSGHSEMIKTTSTKILLHFSPKSAPMPMIIKEIDTIAPSFSSGNLVELKKRFPKIKMRNLPESIVEVDLLIGMDYYNQVIISSHKIDDNLSLSHSHLGLIISGNSPDAMGRQTSDMTTLVVPVLFTESLSQLTHLEKSNQLWNLENLDTKDNPEL